MFALRTFGDPVGIRTLDLLIRSQSLYPAELPSHVGMKADLHSVFSGRGRRNRTLNQWFWRPLLYQLSYTPTKISGFLFSQGASPQVLSAFAGLTAVFGMGTGGSPQLSPLNYVIQASDKSDVSDSHSFACRLRLLQNWFSAYRILTTA